MRSSFLYVGMRSARIKADQTDTWYHCYNRVAGTSRDRPFRDADKEQFVRILNRVCLLYGVRVVAYQVMSNHYHLLVHAPEGMLSPEEMCRRYRAFHRGRKVIEPDTLLCWQWQQRARDISWFMRHLQQLFTMWYNRSRPLRRRGSLWADRFKHTILEGGAAVWACWKYIENNPVRAGMVERVGDYRFCSYGVWRQCGVHPFEDTVIALVLPMLGVSRLDDLKNMMASALDVGAQVDEEARTGGGISCHMRHWVDGLVIGSELFVRGIMAAHHSRASTRRISHHVTHDPPLTCWRRLRISSQVSSRQ
jgi:REP element-mobilizing transposase RayT